MKPLLHSPLMLNAAIQLLPDIGTCFDKGLVTHFRSRPELYRIASAVPSVQEAISTEVLTAGAFVDVLPP